MGSVTAESRAEDSIVDVRFRIAAGSLFGVVLVDPPLGRFAPQDAFGVIVALAGPVHVADGDDLDVVVNQERGHDSLGLVPATDLPDRDPVAGGRGPEDRSGYDPRQDERGGERRGALNEVPPSAFDRWTVTLVHHDSFDFQAACEGNS